jgi:hypothetical protein
MGRKQNHSRSVRPTRHRKHLGRSPIDTPLNEPHLLLDVLSDEALCLIRLLVCRVDRTSSREAENAVTFIETSVADPGNTGNTATWRLAVSRLFVSSPRGYT